MASKSIVEKLWEVNPKAEIWWDSSPLIYENWRSKMIQKAHNKEEDGLLVGSFVQQKQQT